MDYHQLEIGDKAPDIVYALIEIPRGSSNKYEFDLKYNVMRLDRVLHSTVYYPGEYGLIPQTISYDGDPADILVIASNKTFSGCLLRAKPVGLLLMEDSGSHDNKILGVAYDDPLYREVDNYSQLPNHLLKQIENFFESYKTLENKVTKVLGWGDEKQAKEYIKEVHQRYLDSFKEKNNENR